MIAGLPNQRSIARERRRLRIVDAAKELIATHGFSKTTVEEIARRADFSKGLVYEHYDSKDGLPRAVWSRQVDAWMAETRSRVKYSTLAIADTIGDLLAVSVLHARDNPLLCRILSQDPGSLIREIFVGPMEGSRSDGENLLQAAIAMMLEGLRA